MTVLQQTLKSDVVADDQEYGCTPNSLLLNIMSTLYANSGQPCKLVLAFSVFAVREKIIKAPSHFAGRSDGVRAHHFTAAAHPNHHHRRRPLHHLPLG